MLVFHLSRLVGNYAFLESRDKCLQGQLGSVLVSRPVRESRLHMSDISTTVADHCNRP